MNAEKFAIKFRPQKPNEGRIEPFKVVGNVYFVGTYQASGHLIDTGDGLVLIDTGYANTVNLFLKSIRELGFDPKDIKYIVHSHWHWDHTEGTEAFVNITKAKTVIGEHDKDYVIQKGYFTPDVTVADGDTLSLGNTTIRFMHTPGHTKGTVSFFFDAEEDGKTYRVGQFGGAGANSLVKSFPTYYEGCREDYMKSLDKLMREKVDVFIGNHCWNNQTDERGEVVRSGKGNPFIDPSAWTEFLEFCKQRCENLPKE